MPLQESDLKIAQDIKMKAKHLASKCRDARVAVMNPKDLPWHEALELASVAHDAAWCITWLSAEVKRLQEYEQFYKELNDSTRP